MDREFKAKTSGVLIARKAVRIAAVLLTAAAIVVFFTAATQSESERIIKDLICARTAAMNEYFDGGISYKEACVILAEVEKDRLLAEDTESLNKYFATDIEQVKSYEISKVEINYADEDIICAFVEIKWEVNCVDGVYRDSNVAEIEAGYSVMAENCDGAFKLVQFR